MRVSEAERRIRVNLKTVTEIRSSSGNTFIAENVCLVLNGLWVWEPVERQKERSVTVTECYVFLGMR